TTANRIIVFMLLPGFGSVVRVEEGRRSIYEGRSLWKWTPGGLADVACGRGEPLAYPAIDGDRDQRVAVAGVRGEHHPSAVGRGAGRFLVSGFGQHRVLPAAVDVAHDAEKAPVAPRHVGEQSPVGTDARAHVVGRSEGHA